ncbi:hypothetical protein C0Q70_07509 [Pomacea canaliculata]|uniref:Uncharacterized protein n=1 Tax=Pomacea canaliculata TaxID=400727 RepID=A0A2T7PF80_POMCA|nr:hypothetical protein C0Q70_07509 [Pomacea canaliculata]
MLPGFKTDKVQAKDGFQGAQDSSLCGDRLLWGGFDIPARGCSGNRVADWWKACQAFSILGLLTIAGGLLAGIQHAVSENTAKASLAGIATCLSSTVFLTIEVAVFGAKSSESSAYQFDYGFYLSIAACVLSFISAVLFAVGLRL